MDYDHDNDGVMFRVACACMATVQVATAHAAKDAVVRHLTHLRTSTCSHCSQLASASRALMAWILFTLYDMFYGYEPCLKRKRYSKNVQCMCVNTLLMVYEALGAFQVLWLKRRWYVCGLWRSLV